LISGKFISKGQEMYVAGAGGASDF